MKVEPLADREEGTGEVDPDDDDDEGIASWGRGGDLGLEDLMVKFAGKRDSSGRMNKRSRVSSRRVSKPKRDSAPLTL